MAAVWGSGCAVRQPMLVSLPQDDGLDDEGASFSNLKRKGS